MTLPTSGPLTYDDFAGELGVSGSITFPSDITRMLAEKTSGDLVLPTDYHGQQSIKLRAARTSGTATNHSISSIFFGPAFSGRRVAVIFFLVGKPSATVPTGTQNITNITIGGSSVSNAGIAYYQGGSGSAIFTGVAFKGIAKDNDTSGTISFTTPFPTDVGIAVISYPAPSDSAFDQAANFSGSASIISDTINVPANGALIAFAAVNASNLSWSGVTEKTSFPLIGYVCEVAFDNRLDAETGRGFGFNAGTTTQGVLGGVTLAF